MAASNNSQPNGFPDDFFSKDWILFPDYDTPKIHSKDNFDADLSALEKECSPLDSGYFSGENLESSPDNKVTVDDELKTSYFGPTKNVQADFSSLGPATSAKAGHGSKYDGISNQSTATIKEAADTGKQKPEKRSMSHNIEEPSTPKYALFKDEVIAPTPLQSWVEFRQPHEYLAYRLEQTAKRRKTSSERQ
jgi:hypothetical protein